MEQCSICDREIKDWTGKFESSVATHFMCRKCSDDVSRYIDQRKDLFCHTYKYLEAEQ